MKNKNRGSVFQKKAAQLLERADITINGDKPWDITVIDKNIYPDVFLKGSLGFGDGYAAGKWECDQLDVFFQKLLTAKIASVPSVVGFLGRLRDRLINTQSGHRAFQVGQKHYDLGNQMYEFMLGNSMGYSSGMFLKDSDTLTEAQYNKFDALCKKLQLEKGMKVLEIGSGWGTFAQHAAKNYGVEVVGLTVSEEQKNFAGERCSGLPVEFLLLDYQKMDESHTKKYDRVVSIEMIEAVGKKNFKKYFEIVARVMKDDGLFGMQAIIGTGDVDPFLSTRIFPNGLVPSIEYIAAYSEGTLRIKKWASFGKDYDKTLMAWDENFRKHWSEIKNIVDTNGKKMYDDNFYRMWRYYLLCCAGSFRAGHNDVAQIVMSKLNGLSPLR